MSNMIDLMAVPALYQKGNANIWDDEYISKILLNLHLDKNSDAGSRRPDTIEQITAWINDKYLTEGSSILDLGCGPGLYAEKLASMGHKVTGVDISPNSIEYARKEAEKKNLDIEYYNMNYLAIDFENQFDLVMIIYCDFCVLSKDEQQVMLEKIYRALKPGGCFIFDFYSEKYPDSIPEGQSRAIEEQGLWSPEKCLIFTDNMNFPDDKVYLTRYITFDKNDNMKDFRFWTSYFGKDDVETLLARNSFRNIEFRDNFKGEADSIVQEIFFVTSKK